MPPPSADTFDIAPLVMESIGWMRCDLRDRYETHHQAPLARGTEGFVELRAGFDHEQALLGLEGFERIWLLFAFHRNPRAERSPTLIQPPRHEGRVGVFATRSPHRHNGIGMSCVRLLGVEGRRVHVAEIDILDGSPILDIKPYLPEWDAFPTASTGWAQPRRRFEVTFTPAVAEGLARIAEATGQRLDRFAAVQLQFDPLDASRKRIRLGADGLGELSYQRYRLRYRVDEVAGVVVVMGVAEYG